MGPETTFLMVHGFGGSARWWDAQASYLQGKGRVVAVDLPGHGVRPWHAATLEEMADQLLDGAALSPEEPVVGIASSFGGLIVLALAGKYPELLQGIVLAGALPRFTADVDFPAGLSPQAIDKLALQFQGDRAAVMAMFFRSLFAYKERLLPSWDKTRRLFRETHVPELQALEGFLKILSEADLRDVLARVTVPVQLILGDKDPICPLATIKAMRAIRPSLRVDVLKDCGHFPFLSRHEAFNGLLEEFITGVVHGG